MIKKLQRKDLEKLSIDVLLKINNLKSKKLPMGEIRKRLTYFLHEEMLKMDIRTIKIEDHKLEFNMEDA